MGYMCHHAIVVTSFHEIKIHKAYEVAVNLGLGPFLTNKLQTPVNGFWSFFVGPDGSKEGWPESKDGDRKRYEFIKWLNEERYEDGSTPYDWAVIQYGDEMGDNRMIGHEAHYPGLVYERTLS